MHVGTVSLCVGSIVVGGMMVQFRGVSMPTNAFPCLQQSIFICAAVSRIRVWDTGSSVVSNVCFLLWDPPCVCHIHTLTLSTYNWHTHTHTNTENQFTIIRSPRLTYISLLGPQSRCVWVCVCVCTRECNLFMLEPNVLGACLCLSLCANEPWRHPRWHLVCHVFQLDASILTVKYR